MLSWQNKIKWQTNHKGIYECENGAKGIFSSPPELCGEFGSHLPDVDIIIYEPKNYEIVAVISTKVTLRERIAQTGYWKTKLNQDKITKHIKVFFITPDEDKTLGIKFPAKKGRAIVEIDIDGSYILSEEEIDESDKVKKFDKFISDLEVLANVKKNKR